MKKPLFRLVIFAVAFTRGSGWSNLPVLQHAVRGISLSRSSFSELLFWTMYLPYLCSCSLQRRAAPGFAQEGRWYYPNTQTSASPGLNLLCCCLSGTGMVVLLGAKRHLTPTGWRRNLLRVPKQSWDVTCVCVVGPQGAAGEVGMWVTPWSSAGGWGACSQTRLKLFPWQL